MEEMYDSDHCPSVSPLVLLSTYFFLEKLQKIVHIIVG